MQQRSVATRATLLESAGRVFSRLSYADSRLADICDDADISQGSLYFHFGNKADIAAAVLQAQEERMTATLAGILKNGGTGLTKLIAVCEGLAALISSDPVVQGGIKLGMQPGTRLDELARGPYGEWVAIAASLIREGQEDGSAHPDLDPQSAAEFANNLFVGAQVRSELDDSWQSFPARMRHMTDYLTKVLGAEAQR